MKITRQKSRLGRKVRDLLKRFENAAVILSGYPCAETEGLGWRSLPMKHKRSVQARSGSSFRGWCSATRRSRA